MGGKHKHYQQDARCRSVVKLGTGDFAKGARKAECNSQALCHVKRCNCKGLPTETTSSSWPLCLKSTTGFVLRSEFQDKGQVCCLCTQNLEAGPQIRKAGSRKPMRCCLACAWD